MKRQMLIMLALCLALISGCEKRPVYERYTKTFYGTFDTVVTLIGFAQKAETFDEEAGKVQKLLEYYNDVFDAYHPAEGMNNLFTLNERGGREPVSVPEELIDLVLACRSLGGTIPAKTNIAMGAVLSLWHDAREAGIANPENAALPDMAALREAAEHIDFDGVIVDRAAGTIVFADPELSLDLGAVAKGYAADKAAEVLMAGNMPSFILSLGGNVYAGRAPEDGRKYWGVSIQDPDDAAGALDAVYVTETSVVTSGDYQRYYTVDGARYCHLIDPDTLMPATYMRGVSVVCQDSLTADYLSTALFLMPAEDGMALVDALDGAEALWALPDGSVQMTEGFAEAARSQGASGASLAGEAK